MVNPIDLLLADSEDDAVCQVRITDQGSKAQSVKVNIHGVIAHGIIDTAADITIMGGKLFKEVATVARLRKKDFKPADKVPCTYNRQPFNLDGCMDLDITLGNKTIQTPVYIKMDAPDQLLLSEGVCRQLDIVTYHKDVRPHKEAQGAKHSSGKKTQADSSMAQVNMTRTVHLLPHQSIIVEVRINPNYGTESPLLVEQDGELEEITGLQMEDTVVQPTKEGLAHVTQILSYLLSGMCSQKMIVRRSYGNWWANPSYWMKSKHKTYWMSSLIIMKPSAWTVRREVKLTSLRWRYTLGRNHQGRLPPVGCHLQCIRKWPDNYTVCRKLVS